MTPDPLPVALPELPTVAYQDPHCPSDLYLHARHWELTPLVRKSDAEAALRAQAEEVAALRADAERWRMASTSRTFGISDWHEFGQRTIYDKLAAERIDAHLAASKQEKPHG